jgi:hypothetical protein
MGSMLLRAIDEAGFSAIRERALAGETLGADELERLRGADLLVVAGLADLVRKRFRGDEVRVVGSADLRAAGLAVFAGAELLSPGGAAAQGGTPALTGGELLREIALSRLRLPSGQGLAVSLDELGLELAQTALVFGADVLFGDLGGKRTLPLADGPDARRAELKGLIERAGRSVVFGLAAAAPREDMAS